MRRKINILIVIAVATLLALVSIQAYLMYNTYELKKRAFLVETKDAIDRIDDETPSLDAIGEIWGQRLLDLLAAYKLGQLTKEEVLMQLTMTADSTNARFNAIYREEIKKLNLGYEVKFKKNIDRIILLDSVANDTIYPLGKNKGKFLVGENFSDDTAYPISASRWISNYYEEGRLYGNELKDVEFDFRVDTQDLMNIADWKRILIGRMAVLFAGSLILLLFAVGLFYYSIKNLIKQKKVAEVKTDFINNITHELKTPLATMGIASKSLKKKEIFESPEIFQNTLMILDRQNDRLQKLIDQVMTNSLSSEELVLNKENVLDNEYFNNIIADFSLSAEQKNVKINAQIEQEEVYLRLDTFLFTTALFNILENAIKYGRESVDISIKTRLGNNFYEITISDNGIGISENDSSRVFDKFFRVASGNIHTVKGLGLGLYYSKQVVDAHGGTIAVQSEMGKGSQFKIILPLN